jgi:hypothetical protein
VDPWLQRSETVLRVGVARLEQRRTSLRGRQQLPLAWLPSCAVASATEHPRLHTYVAAWLPADCSLRMVLRIVCFVHLVLYEASVPWAEVSLGKRGKEVPTGEKCYRCCAFHTATLPHMPWAVFLSETKKSERFATEVNEALEKFKPDGVDNIAMQQQACNTSKSVSIKVSRHGLFLSRQEWDILFPAMSPEAASVPSMSCVDDSGVKSKGYLLKDPARPHRTFEVSGEMEAQLSTEAMGQSSNLFKSQGERVFSNALVSGGHKVYAKLLSGQVQLNSIEDLRLRGPPRAGLAGPSGKHPASDDENSEDENEGETTAGLDGEAPAEDKVGSTRGCDAASAAGAVHSPFVRRQSFGESQTGKSAKKTRLTDDADTDTGMAQSVVHWQRQLDIAKVLAGKALGRERSQAELCASRLQGQGQIADAATLRSHLRLVKAAEGLRNQSIVSLDKDDRMRRVKDLVEGDVDFPSETKHLLWQARIGDIVECLQQGPEPEVAAAQLLEVVAPFDFKGTAWNPLKPTLAALDGSVLEACVVWAKRFFKDIVIPLVASGKKSRSIVLHLAEQGFRQADIELPEDVDIHIEKHVCEARLCFGALLALLSLETHEDCACYVREVMEAKVGVAVRSLRDALRDNEEYSNILTEFSEKASSVAQYTPKLKASIGKLGSLDLENDAACSTLTSLCSALLEYQAVLEKKHWAHFNTSLCEVGTKFVQGRLASDKALTSADWNETAGLLTNLAAAFREGPWAESLEQVQIRLQTTTQTEKFETLRLAVDCFTQKVGADMFVDPEVNFVKELRTAAEACRGLRLPGAHAAGVQGASLQMLLEAWEQPKHYEFFAARPQPFDFIVSS